ncbi:MAG: STAS domain-containing protein [Syntrophorhabdales bacterium]|jgi:ABC-type transporter Mla MlaB component
MIDFRLEDTTQGPTLKLCGELTIESGERLKAILLESIEGSRCLFLDLAEVTAVDAAGFQLLFSALGTEGYRMQGGDLAGSLPEGMRRAAVDAGYAKRGGTV